MPNNVNAEVTRSYSPQTDVYQEIQNQQLNEALASGTVTEILMKDGYVPTSSMNVVVNRDIQNFITLNDVNEAITNQNFDFGFYDANRYLLVKRSAVYASTVSVPSSLQIGEIAVDNYDGSLYLLGNKGATVQKVDAGTVNGFNLERDVLSNTTGTGMLNETEIKALINSAFSYDAGTNSLTIQTI